MTARELAAAGITDPRLRAAYLSCRELNARHGRTYFLATRLLTADRRPAVHALYGFARWADDIVDDLGNRAPVAEKARALDRLQADLATGLSTGRSSHPVVAALADTAERYGIEHRHFTDFMASIRMDLDTTDYATWDDLARYVRGSAAVIGLQVLPVLGTCAPRAEAAPHAASLGVAFQLTNFLRDVGEDLERGRVYLPADRLAAHGVDHELLARCRRTGERDGRVVEALRELVAFNRGIYRHAALGVPMLAAVSRPCVSTALVLYSGILDRIEAAGYAPVLRRRVAVPEHRRATVALAGLLRVTAARTRHRLAARPVPPWPGACEKAAPIAEEHPG
ncbi:phytoene/squalene synthase family protein [Streptomyces sp. NBC_01429]|uniref:phytoene/squalene synthase family protein n=1 Tax=Streptomyces sp. NBC_01429 TaxID=2903862 RepID=UPI002E2C824F|nr:phytoene/squalene synthase family protein [Streptomyces sp. NBC_01429]